MRLKILLAIWLFFIIAAAWTYWDARKNKIGKISNFSAINNLTAGEWARAIFFYIKNRRELILRAAQYPVEPTGYSGWVAISIIFTVWAFFASLALSGEHTEADQQSTEQEYADINQQAKQRPANEWNMADPDASTNGNILIAIRKLRSENQIIVNNAEPASVLKAPWKFYGTLQCFSGTVTISQDYPPGSDISKSFAESEVGEIVMMHNDGTIIDVIAIGGTGATTPGARANICGLPAGRVEVTNGLGGTATQLLLVSGIDWISKK